MNGNTIYDVLLDESYNKNELSFEFWVNFLRENTVASYKNGIKNITVLWENKGLNNKSWNDTLKKGVKTSKPLYYSQAQTYMAYMELTNGCVFTFLNRDSGELASEFLPFDARQAQESSDRAVRVIKSSRPTELSKCTNDPADFRCKWCNFKRTCWDAGITTVTTEDTLPSWLRKK